MGRYAGSTWHQHSLCVCADLSVQEELLLRVIQLCGMKDGAVWCRGGCGARPGASTCRVETLCMFKSVVDVMPSLMKSCPVEQAAGCRPHVASWR